MKKKGKSREGKPEPFSLSRYTYNTEQVLYVTMFGRRGRCEGSSPFPFLFLLCYSLTLVALLCGRLENENK